MAKKIKSIQTNFEARVGSIESIFSSYRTLHELYVNVMKSANVNPNNLIAFERLKKTAADEQVRISNGLYSQGFILITGASEALLKDVFVSLLTENFTLIKSAKGINVTTAELQSIMIDSKAGLDSFDHMSAAFGKLITKKIFSSQNPTEKINFQNVKTMKDVFSQYFNLEFTNESVLSSIHRYWQMRHCIVHTNSIIDERFTHNVGFVGLLKENESIGRQLIVDKEDFNVAKKDFVLLFEDLNNQILKHKLKSRFVT